MRITLITPPSQNIEPCIPIFRSKGVIVDVNSVHPEVDFIICTGQAYIRMLDVFYKGFPEIPLVNYTLDFYKTVWTAPNPHNYDWEMYRDYLKKCEELWCLSNEVIMRMGEEGIDIDRCIMLKIWARFFDYDGPIVDNRYILNTIRPYVADKNYGWLKKACAELNIPLKEPNHGASEAEFQKLIAECSFMCTEYHETSTGGLGLLEGYKLGKVSVVSDSPYEGVRDYLGDRAIYFDDNSYEDFKRVIKETWDNTPQLDIKDCEAFCAAHPTLENMVDTMIERLHLLQERLNEQNNQIQNS